MSAYSAFSAVPTFHVVNPRKAYPIDPGLISLYERTGRGNFGHALETVILLELERPGCEIDYVRTGDGYEMDFFARDPARGCWAMNCQANRVDI